MTSGSGLQFDAFSRADASFRHDHGGGRVLRAGRVQRRVHVLPTTKGIDHRIINGRVFIGGVPVTDPAEVAARGRVPAARLLLLQELGAAVRPVEGQDEGADRRGAGASQPRAARPRADGDHVQRRGRGRQPCADRHLPHAARRLFPDVAPPLRVPAARLRRLPDLLQLLQQGLP